MTLSLCLSRNVLAAVAGKILTTSHPNLRTCECGRHRSRQAPWHNRSPHASIERGRQHGWQRCSGARLAHLHLLSPRGHEHAAAGSPKTCAGIRPRAGDPGHRQHRPGADSSRRYSRGWTRARGAGRHRAEVGCRVGPQSRRRLDLPAIGQARVAESLKRPGVRVFPVLVGDAVMPSAEDLRSRCRP